jgi:hypothetical protein
MINGPSRHRTYALASGDVIHLVDLPGRGWAAKEVEFKHRFVPCSFQYGSVFFPDYVTGPHFDNPNAAVAYAQIRIKDGRQQKR